MSVCVETSTDFRLEDCERNIYFNFRSIEFVAESGGRVTITANIVPFSVYPEEIQYKKEFKTR